MALEISGKVLLILPEQTGTGKNGQWNRQDFVIETQEQYPRKVCISAWGEKAGIVKSLKAGSMVNVSFNVESREFNSKWYTDLRAWKIEAGVQQAPQQDPVVQNLENLEPLSASEEVNDLPF